VSASAASAIRAPSSRRLVPELVTFVRRYVVMPDEQLLVVALWIIHTHCVEAFEQTPYLSVTSPEKQCGKSRLLEVLELVVARPWMVALPSEAVVYRHVQEVTPTMLLDETDAIFNPRTADKYEGLRALLNSGHRRGAKVPRCIGTSTDIAEFSTFCAKVLAGIGMLPDTVADRSIPIRLERRTRDEEIDRFRRHEVKPTADVLRKQIVRWAAQNGATFADVHPAMPDELSDRMQESCESVVVIADALGCGDDARTALVTLFAAERLDDQETMRMRLLRDIRTVFGEQERAIGKRCSAVRTETLVLRLSAMEEAPWGTYYGRGIEPRDIASLLRHFGIRSTTVRAAGAAGARPAKGYKRDHLQAAWDRYLPVTPVTDVTRIRARASNGKASTPK
jgi:uncharacterized protein DUF3631